MSGKKKIKRPAYRGTSEERKLSQLYRNGITTADLKHDYDLGFENGRVSAQNYLLPLCYSGAALALRNMYSGKSRFGKKRIRRFLRDMDNIIVGYITAQEAVDDMYKETGIRLDFERFTVEMSDYSEDENGKQDKD